MISPWRKAQLVLIMLWLPLQGAMAANMSLCLKAKDMSDVRLDTPDTPASPLPSISAVPGMAPCAAEKAMGVGSDTSDIPHIDQHSMADEELTQGIADEVAPALKCDGTPCHASCTAPIPSAASATRPGDRTSYATLFNSHFSLLVLEQLQRPPLA
jgi:hypothetical protein